MKHMHCRIVLSIMVISIAVLFASVPLRADSEADAEEQYTRGAEFAAVERYTDAIAAWQQVLSGFGDQQRVCANAELAIGRAYRSLNQMPAAQQQFQELATAYPTFRRQNVEALVEAAGILETKREFVQAIVIYGSVSTKYPDMSLQCAQAKLRIAACRAALGQGDAELTELQGIVADHLAQREERAQAMMRIGQILSQKNDYDAAMAQFEKVQTDFADLGAS